MEDLLLENAAEMELGIGCVSAATAISSQSWVVSWNGSDVRGCGSSLAAACSTIQFAVDQSLDGDTILIDGRVEAFETGHMHEHCTRTATPDVIVVRRSLTFRGLEGSPFMGCRAYSPENTVFSFVAESTPDGVLPLVTLEQLWIQNGAVRFTNIRLVVRQTVFVNATLRTQPESCVATELEVTDSLFQRQALCESDTDCNKIMDSAISCENVTAKVQRTDFEDTNIVFYAVVWANISITWSRFQKNVDVETGMGGVNVTLPRGKGRLYVGNSIFFKLGHVDPIYSAINIEAAALRISEARVSKEPILKREDIETEVLVENCEFRNNERGISITRTFDRVTIRGCQFLENTGMHAAAGIRLAVNNTSKVRIEDCRFESNNAGHNWHENIPGRFMQDGDQVQIRNKLINGIISLVGKGGAVRIQRGNVTFFNCTFLNNTARLLGGAVCVDREGSARLEHCQFENALESNHAMQGELLYSTGKISVASTDFIVLSTEDHLSILRHSGEPWSLTVEDMWFQCPVGHRLVMVNTTSHKLDRERSGLIRSTKLDQMYYYCETCGKNQYSLDAGALRYTLTDNDTEYYTLLINGKEPFKSHSVNFSYGNITCHDCPYGGDCEQGLIAVANFWGYRHRNAIKFQHCPNDYCCASQKCHSYDGCAKHRHGRLCGLCLPGYSEALFSSVCVPDDTCRNNGWLIALTMGMGLLYASFLVFQKDVRDFMSSWKVDLRRLPCCYRRKKPHVVAYVHQKSDVNLSRLMQDHNNETEPLNNVANDAAIATQNEDSEKKSREASCLITLFYYFQDSLLLHIDTVYTKTASKLEKQLRAFLLGLFRFRLDFYQFMDDICLSPGMQPVTKIVLKMLFVPFILLLFGVFHYILRVWVRCQRGKTSRHLDTEKKMASRLATGFVLAVLFTYQKMATATFTLLNCVPVGDESVLFIDGTKACFQTWQYGIMAYAFTSVVPFSFILMVGPPLLKRKQISLREFFLGCICPLPALAYWLVRYRSHKPSAQPLPEQTGEVLSLLQGPFKEPKSKQLVGQLCWAGVLIARRLVLFLCFTFINDVLLRLLCMLGVCFVILMHHMYVRPYSSFLGNLAGAISAAALLIVGAINLLRASFEAAEYIPTGPYRPLMEACEEVENTLVLWLPLVGMSVLVLFLGFRLFLLVAAKLCGKSQHSDGYPSHDDENADTSAKSTGATSAV